MDICQSIFNNITIIGNGSRFANDLPNTSFFATYHNTLYLFECSNDTFKYIQNHDELQQYEKWIICISHMHEDHCNGIGSLLYWLRFHWQFDMSNVTIICSRRIDMQLYLQITSPNADVGVNIVDNDFENIKLFQVQHVENMRSIGFITSINGKDIFAYTGDCTHIPQDILIKYNNDDIYGLITECTLFNSNIHQPIYSLLQQINFNKWDNVLLMHFDNLYAVSIIFDILKNELDIYTDNRIMALSRLLPGIRNTTLYHQLLDKIMLIADNASKLVLASTNIDNSLRICNKLDK